MRSILTLNFSNRCTKRCASNILNGFSPTVIVRHASPTNRGLLSCSALLRRSKIQNYECKDKKTRALALAKSRCTPVTGSDSALVRRFQSANWSGSRLSGSMVCDVAHKLGKAKKLRQRNV